MKVLITTLTCLLLLSSAIVCAAQNSVFGEWVGGYEINGNYTPVKAQFETDGDETKVIFDLPMRQETGIVLNQVKFQSPNLHFELPRRTAAVIFGGKINGETIIGTVRQGDVRGTFHLVRIASVNPKVFNQYEGEYELERGKYVYITRSTFPIDGISFFESGSNRFGQLFPASETTFFAGKGRLVPFPVEINVAFIKKKSGEVTGLKWKPQGGGK